MYVDEFQRRSNGWTVLGVVGLIVCSGGCTPPSDRWTEAQTLKNHSIALLENGAEVDKEGKMLSEAAQGFRRLSVDQPLDPIGLQNLCVTLYSRLKWYDPNDLSVEAKAICSEFESSIGKLRRLSPVSPDPDYLLFRYFQWKNERASAIQALRSACKVPQPNPASYYQLVQLLKEDNEQDHTAEIQQQLEEAMEIAPSNLPIAVNYLDALAKRESPEFAKELERVRELSRPLTSRTQSPIPALIDRAADAAKNSNWKGAQTQIAFLRNVMVSEIAYQQDLHALEPHILELVKLEFLPQSLKPPATKGFVTNQTFQHRDPLSFLGDQITAIASEDIDLDGNRDVVVASSSGLEAWTFEKPNPSRIFSQQHSLPVRGIALADLDRDFQVRKDSLPPSALPPTNPEVDPSSGSWSFVDTDLDIIVFGDAGVAVYRNDLDATTGKRSLTKMEPAERLSKLRNVRSVAVIDFDHDADLDLVVSSDEGVSLWSNRGDWSFADFTKYSNLPTPSQSIDSILAMDLDRNVLNDFLLCGSTLDAPIQLTNNLHGRYKPQDQPWSKELTKSCTSSTAIDANGDACWDLVICGNSGTRLVLMKSVGRQSWVPDRTTVLSTQTMQGVVDVDYDNDGACDIVAWGEMGMELFRGTERGKLERDRSTPDLKSPIRQLAVGDLDRDRDEDLMYLLADGRVAWSENVDGNKNQQLDVVIRADEDGKQRPRERCNMHGVGSMIELKSGGQYQARIVRGTRTRFGVGTQSGADIMRVVWTNGVPNNVLQVSSKSTIFDQQKLAGSCPYLYAWNGERFEFCTDCLWAAPIGLQFAQGVAAPTRDWEYLKIDGRLLKPKSGKYQLQVTEELWEAAYFDAVQLLAIDHPREIEVFTNEKVGPAELAGNRVFTVDNRRAPSKVIDQKGRDLRSLVLSRDHNYAKCWESGINQGLTETHWLEIDFKESEQGSSESNEIVLFLTGWVFPTSTSVNVSMAENPLKPKLAPPSIQVPNSGGEWVEVIPYAGFPGGKTKTIAIDLTGKFLCDDHRVRITTNMELCWDEVFYTRGERTADPDQYRLTPLKFLHADLHFRGFSKASRQPGNAPDLYDYNEVSVEPIWPPMYGNFTRYGDVTDLVREPDDTQVVMGAGDEMTVTFAVGDTYLPDGWVRDFVIYNVGWDKDADLNTIHGQNVAPLPFRAMSKYPYEPDEKFPESPQHQEFLDRYQNRTQEMKSFWNLIRDAS